MEANNANEARIKQLFYEGFTTKDSLRPHVSCADDTITRVLSRIKEELLETSQLSVKGFNLLDTLKEMRKHGRGLDKDLNAVSDAMALEESGSKVWLDLQKRKMEIQREVRKLNGGEALLEIQKAQAVKSVEEVKQVIEIPPKPKEALNLPEGF